MARPKDNSTAIILGLIAAGVVCGLIVVGGWLAFRHPNESEAAKRQREHDAMIQKQMKSGEPNMAQIMAGVGGR